MAQEGRGDGEKDGGGWNKEGEVTGEEERVRRRKDKEC